jgi:hypothetical protein
MGSGTLSSMNSAAGKVRENRLRRVAARRGLRLERSRRRDEQALDYGKYRLVSVLVGALATDYNLTLDDVENALTGEM